MKRGNGLSRRVFISESAAALVGVAVAGEVQGPDILVAAQSRSELPDSAIRRLRSSLRGHLIRLGEPNYDRARQVWNASVDKRPRLIARCTRATDVLRCMEFARQYGVPIAVRGGGHHPAGTAISDSGLVIDLSQMKDVAVDRRNRLIRVQPGVVSRELHGATEKYGLVLPTGTISTVGVAGLTLGGGEGWLNGKYGLTCDNLIAADVITANGRRIRADKDREPDLYWGLRGGGGNFGVVTSFEYLAHPLTDVVTGGFVNQLDRAQDALRYWRDYVRRVPDELTSLASLVYTPDPVLSLGVCYVGSDSGASTTLAPLERIGGSPASVSRVPTLKLHTMFDVGSEPGFHYYVTSLYVSDLTDEAVDVFVDHFRRATSTNSVAFLFHLHGAFSRVGISETAYCHRGAQFVFGVVVRWSEPGEAQRHVRWAREFWSAMRPFSTGEVYGNFIADTGPEWAKAAYGSNYERMAAVKRRYDPTNVFRSNINVPPSA